MIEEGLGEEQEVTAPLEVEALHHAWEARSNAVPQHHAWVQWAAKTDLGQVRENNEDKFEFFEPEDPATLALKGRVYAVADGMGGHSAGQVAAELSLNVFIRSYYADLTDDVQASAHRAVDQANAFVVDVASSVTGRSGMGATLVAGILRDDELLVVWVGDSRCYLVRNHQIEQVTEDHSWVAEQVRAGTMTLEQAEQSPFRNIITRSMGGARTVEPEFAVVKVQAGDRFLFCSDGLSGMVSDAEILELTSSGSPSAATWNLVDRANRHGGKDNITAFLLRIAEVLPWPEGQAEGAESGESEQSNQVSNNSPAVETLTVVSESLTVETPKGGLIGRFFRRG